VSKIFFLFLFFFFRLFFAVCNGDLFVKQSFLVKILIELFLVDESVSEMLNFT